MDSLRLEKCYRGWKSDMTHEYTPLMASLDRFVDFQKPEFKGMAALAEESRRGPKERLVPLVLDEAGDADAPSCAAVWQNGTRVGLVTTAGYGHAIGRSIALAYVRSDLAAARHAAGDRDPRRAPAPRWWRGSRSTIRRMQGCGCKALNTARSAIHPTPLARSRGRGKVRSSPSISPLPLKGERAGVRG